MGTGFAGEGGGSLRGTPCDRGLAQWAVADPETQSDEAHGGEVKGHGPERSPGCRPPTALNAVPRPARALGACDLPAHRGETKDTNTHRRITRKRHFQNRGFNGVSLGKMSLDLRVSGEELPK